jgi:hypothetical protein
MRTCFFCGDEIAYNDSGTNEFMQGGWIKPNFTLEWKKVVLNVSIKTESLDDPHICVECLYSVYTRLGKKEDDRVFLTERSKRVTADGSHV